MNPSLKKWIISLSVVLALGISFAIAIAYFNEDKIRAITIEQLNTVLETKVDVKSIEFSLLRRFPRASIQFKGITIEEKSERNDKVNLLEASSLFLEFDPFDLLTGNYTIDQVHVSDARFNIVFFKDGSNNFQFVKEDGGSEKFRVELNHVTIKNSSLRYLDVKNKFVLETEVKDLKMSGDFQSDIYDLEFSANSTVHRFSTEGFGFNRDREFSIDMVLNIERESHTYRIRKAKSTLDGLMLTYSGSYIKKNDAAVIDLTFQSEKFKFQSAVDLLPPSFKNSLSAYEAKGIIELNGFVKGEISNASSPKLDLTFLLKDGALTYADFRVDEIDISGSFNNGQNHSLSSSMLTIDDVSFRGKQGKSKGNFSIKNFNHPFLAFELESFLDLGDLTELIKNDSIESLEGKCTYVIKGETDIDSLSSISVSDIKNAKVEGSLVLNDGRLKWKGYAHAIENIEARARFGKNLIYVDTLNFSLAGISSEMSGQLYNFFPYLFFKNEKLQVQSDIYYPNLDLNMLFASNDENDEKSGIFIPVSEKMILNLSLKADKFKYKKFSAENVTCAITSKHPYLIAKDISLDAMEGGFIGWMEIDISRMDHIVGTSQLTLKQVNIQQLFYQFENFGQDNILDKNLEGYANASIDFYAAFDENFTIRQESVVAATHIEIKNGKLIDYKPILALSDYVDVEELKEIKFSKLINDIEIKNRKVIIPEMDIKSSALELNLSGTHSFDNDIDYRFQLYLSDVLFKKAKRSKKNKKEFEGVEADESGRAKLFIRMYGKVDDYKIKLDRKALREKWKDDMQDERQELKDLFRTEFGNKKKKESEKSMQFEVEWEELEPRTPDGDSIAKKNSEEQKKKPVVKDQKDEPFKKKLGKPVKDEYEEYDPDKFD